MYHALREWIFFITVGQRITNKLMLYFSKEQAMATLRPPQK